MGLTTFDRLSLVADSRPEPPREIAFLAEYGAPDDILVRAAEIAAEIGVSPDAALLGEGLVSEEFFYQSLADRVRAPYHVGRVALDTTASPARALNTGIVYLAPLAAPYRAIASPRGPAIRLLLDAADQGRLIPGLAISSPKRLGALIRFERGGEIARLASLGLHRDCPELCARGEMRPSQTIAAAGFGLGMIALAYVAPWLERTVLSLILWALFSASVWLRSAAAIAVDTPRQRVPLSDAELPVYTVIIAMYREGSIVPKLVAALDAFDYPKAKLDIKLAIESGDKETLAALIALRLPARYEIVIAPPGAPRTKPRALNIALEAARGELLVVYDAEDEPAPDQLRKAAAGFAAEPSLDAMQGRLKIANAGDNWLTFMFAVEYAALFELINPGLCALDLPIALGGSTNHFRTSALRRVGGWDAWNVTEDADLGLRLARFGARVGSLDSDTWEEAPTELGNWFRQRVRWQKGWMQTMIVHTRQPLRFFRELGALRGASGLTLIVGTVMTGLLGPPFLAAAIWRGITELASETPISRLADVYTYILTLLGAQVVFLPAVIAMRRRGLVGAGRAALLMPGYFALVTAATWVALIELIVRPFHWHKTKHAVTASTTAKIAAPSTIALR